VLNYVLEKNYPELPVYGQGRMESIWHVH